MNEEGQEANSNLTGVHEVVVPEIAVQWVIKNCFSNQELATLSNVCRSWRLTAVNVIQSAIDTTTTEKVVASEDNTHSEQYDSTCSSMADQKQAETSVLLRQGGEDQGGAVVLQSRSTAITSPLPLTSLLLPSMARERIRRLHSSLVGNNPGTIQPTEARNAALSSNSTAGSSRAQPVIPDGVVPQDRAQPRKKNSLSSTYSHPGPGIASNVVSQQRHHPILPQNAEDETYCLSWFHPDGIELLTSSSLIKSSNSPSRHRNIQSENVNDCSGYGAGYMEPKNESFFMDQPTALEWRSYVKACDILQPFGYALSFIKSILGSENGGNNKSFAESVIGGQSRHQYHNQYSRSATSVAVRGATVARPQLNSRRQNRRRRAKENLRPSSKAQTNNNNLAMLRKLRPEQLHEILPRVVLERAHHPGPSSNISGPHSPVTTFSPLLCDDGDITNTVTQKAEERPRLLAVEFLNAQKTRAVCLKTPPFACGLVTQPITIFLVGIATEDGIYLSGLDQRMELGHMYPPNTQALSNLPEQHPFLITDQSNVCMSTDATAIPPSTSAIMASEGEGLGRATPAATVQAAQALDSSDHTSKCSGSTDIMFFDSHSSDDEDFLSDENGDSDDDDSSCSSSSSSSMSDDLHDDEVIRGRTGPGQWHCYTAIFNGTQSEMRVDGILENVDGAPSFCTGGVLDGLTLGADHKFHLSLCCGSGVDIPPGAAGGIGVLSEGEGEGAIAEVAVFKGQMSRDDVEAMEAHLMTKHGIPSVTKQDWVEDDLRRQVYYLMSRPPVTVVNISQPGVSRTAASPASATKIPLKIAAQHPSVSWYKEHPVTGTKLSIKRIGCRPGNESSDW